MLVCALAVLLAVLMGACMGSRFGGQEETVTPDLQPQHCLHILSRRRDILRVCGVAFELHGVRKPLGHLRTYELGQQAGKLIR